ncbi:MAG: S8 family serine peptidase [Candidatus Sericytochromatia bacterium]|uniref:S8 family serine peptidase n=1 Tax=Candidatus Tanganyikabacteria bacterium TaxID=2961651 RepID=A0A937X2T9_9BACT|nr:S8 family serine peptidase [Candidatus Tanganyikabacteria bacterium]
MPKTRLVAPALAKPGRAGATGGPRVAGFLLAFTGSVFALAGCGIPVVGQGNLALRGTEDGMVEASKATLAKRLIVGFSTAPSKTALSQIEKSTGTKHVKSIRNVRMSVFEASGDVRKARKALLSTKGVDFVEGELLPEREPIKMQMEPLLSLGITDDGDPNRKDQWYLDTIGAPKVWEAAGTLKPVIVGLVDTGVDLEHPDLKPILVEGWNAADPGKPPMDEAGHGTMTAGCVAAVHNNGQGIAGVSNNAKIKPVKIGNSASSMVEAMMWAADNSDMISMSLSWKPGMPDYPGVVESTKRAAEYVMGKNVPMACSMGNTGNSQRNVPSAFAGKEVPNLIAVGATDNSDKVTSFSTYGPWTTVSAPGRSIMTTTMRGRYSRVDGTSFSTPITAGVMAMMLGKGMAKDPAVIRTKLMNTAVDIEAPGQDDKAGAGRIDAFRAVME